MGVSVDEFLWNLQLILHNRHPFGLRVSRLEDEYSKFSGVRLKPWDVVQGTQDWMSTIQNSPTIAKFLKLTTFDSSSTQHNIKSSRNVCRVPPASGRGGGPSSSRGGGGHLKNNNLKSTPTPTREDPLIRPICPRDEREFREIWKNANYQNVINYSKLYSGGGGSIVGVGGNFIEIPDKVQNAGESPSSSQNNNTLMVNNNLIKEPSVSAAKKRKIGSSISPCFVNIDDFDEGPDSCGSSASTTASPTPPPPKSFEDILNPEISIEELPNMMPPVLILPSSPPQRPSSGSNSSSNCTRVLTPRSRSSSSNDQDQEEILGDPLAFCEDIKPSIIKKEKEVGVGGERRGEFMFVALPIPDDPEMFEDEDVTVMEPAEFILDEMLVTTPPINFNNQQKQQQQVPSTSSNATSQAEPRGDCEYSQSQLYRQLQQQKAIQSELYKRLLFQQQNQLIHQQQQRQQQQQSNPTQLSQFMGQQQPILESIIHHRPTTINNTPTQSIAQQQQQRLGLEKLVNRPVQQQQQNIVTTHPSVIIQPNTSIQSGIQLQHRQQQIEINRQIPQQQQQQTEPEEINRQIQQQQEQPEEPEDLDAPIIISVVSASPEKRSAVQNESSRILTDRPEITTGPYKGPLSKSDLDSVLYDPEGSWLAIPSNNFLFPPRIFHKGDKGEGLFWYDPDNKEWKSYENEIMTIVLPNNTVVLGQVVEFIIESPDPNGGGAPVNTYKDEFHIFDAGRIGGLDISHYSYTKRHQLTVRYFTSPKMSLIVRSSIKVKMHCGPAEISNVLQKIVWKEIAQHTLPFMWDSHDVYLTLAGFLFINCAEMKSFYNDSRILWENIEDLNVITKFTSPSLYHLREILHQKEERQKKQEELKKQQQIQQQIQQNFTSIVQQQQQIQQQSNIIPGAKNTSPETISHLARLIHQRHLNVSVSSVLQPALNQNQNQQLNYNNTPYNGGSNLNNSGGGNLNNTTSVIVPSPTHTVNSYASPSSAGNQPSPSPPTYNEALSRRNSRHNSIEILDNTTSPLNNYGNLTPSRSCNNSSPNATITYHYGEKSPRSITPIQQHRVLTPIAPKPVPAIPMISVSANNQNLFTLPMTHVPNVAAFPSPPNVVYPQALEQQQLQQQQQQIQRQQQQQQSLLQQQLLRNQTGQNNSQNQLYHQINHQNQNYSGTSRMPCTPSVSVNSNLNNLLNTPSTTNYNLPPQRQQQPVLFNSQNTLNFVNNPMLSAMLGNAPLPPAPGPGNNCNQLYQQQQQSLPNNNNNNNNGRNDWDPLLSLSQQQNNNQGQGYDGHPPR